MGLVVKTTKRFKNKNSADAKDPKIQANKLNRNFKVYYANQVWVADITEIKTKQGKLYLAAYMDLYSRKVVGYAIDTHIVHHW